MLQSVSRLIGEVVSPEVRSAGQEVRRLMAAYKEKEDLISIGAYQQGVDPLTDTGLLPYAEGGEDADRREHPGADVGDGNRDRQRRALFGAVDGHHPRHALRDPVEPAALGVGPGLAEP